jgi:dihydroneopterin aldolase
MEKTLAQISLDTVFIEGLRVDAVIGVFDWERQITQPVIVDLEMRTNIRKAGQTDEIDDAVNYKTVSDEVSRLIIDCKAKLLEFLAEKIAAHILTDFSVDSVKVTLRKPTAVPDAKAVGVSIERHRDHIRAEHRL